MESGRKDAWEVIPQAQDVLLPTPVAVPAGLRGLTRPRSYEKREATSASLFSYTLPARAPNGLQKDSPPLLGGGSSLLGGVC